MAGITLSVIYDYRTYTQYCTVTFYAQLPMKYETLMPGDFYGKTIVNKPAFQFHFGKFGILSNGFACWHLPCVNKKMDYR
jgi:hypothetical protein